MSGQELETAVRHNLALTVVVFRNGVYGTIALHQARHFKRTAGVTIGDVDVAAVARGYGAEAWTARTEDELDAALGAARECGRTAVVDVLVDPDVLTPGNRLGALLDARS
jgi:acetolactate synthase-1/2/3 large subunit